MYIYIYGYNMLRLSHIPARKDQGSLLAISFYSRRHY